MEQDNDTWSGARIVQLTSEGTELADSETLLRCQSFDDIDLTVGVGHGVRQWRSETMVTAGLLLQWKETIVRAVTA